MSSEELAGVEEDPMSAKALCCNLLKHYPDIWLVLARSKTKKAPHFCEALFVWCRHQESNSGPTDYKSLDVTLRPVKSRLVLPRVQ